MAAAEGSAPPAVGGGREIAIPFIVTETDAHGKERFVVTAEAIDYLGTLNGRLAVVTIAGIYRSGKSYLLNRLMGKKLKSAFTVGNTVNACTKGIWLWGQALEVGSGDMQVLFMDTEGLSSTIRGESYDVNIFALSVLLSSLFVYNSKGVIDSEAISKLSLVVNLTKHIQVRSGAGEEQGMEYKEVFPNFVWVVRDFTLNLKKDGVTIKPRQYLDDALQPEPGFSEEVTQKNTVRNQIRDFFPSRECVTMPIPVVDEGKLGRLSDVPDEELKPTFVKSLDRLRRMVVDNARPKELFGQPVTGSMLAHLAQQYVEAINDSKAPVISSAWQRVVDSQCTKAVEEGLQAYSTAIAQDTTDAAGAALPVSTLHLAQSHSRATGKAVEKFEAVAVKDPKELPAFQSRLRDKLGAEFEAAVHRAEEASRLHCGAVLDALLPQLQEELTRQLGVDPTQATAPDVTRAYAGAVAWLREQYYTQAEGSHAAGVLEAALGDPSGVVAAALAAAAAQSKAGADDRVRVLREEVTATQQRAEGAEGKVVGLTQDLAAERARGERDMAAAKAMAATTEAALTSQLAASHDEAERWSSKVDKLTVAHTSTADKLTALVSATQAELAAAGERLAAVQDEALSKARGDASTAKQLVVVTEANRELSVKVTALEGQLSAAVAAGAAAGELSASRESELEALREQVGLLFESVQVQKDLVAARTEEKEEAEFQWGATKAALTSKESELIDVQDDAHALENAAAALLAALSEVDEGRVEVVYGALEEREQAALDKL